MILGTLESLMCPIFLPAHLIVNKVYLVVELNHTVRLSIEL